MTQPTPPQTRANRDEILRALDVLTMPGAEVELRAIDVQQQGSEKPYPISKCFTDPHELANEAFALDSYAKGIYVTLNPLKAGATGSTADTDIALRRWFPVDVDPKRPANTAASDVEHEGASRRAAEIRTFLAGLGWPEPVEADSGNGAHLLYRIALPNDDASRKLIQTALKALDVGFSGDGQNVDTGVHNAARIWKLYGTVARKGDNSPERPHRVARLLHVPSEVGVVTREQLEALAALLPNEREAVKDAEPSGVALDAAAWLAGHEIEVDRTNQRTDCTVYRLVECPWADEHSDGTDGAAVIQLASGALVFKCHHAHCAERGWRDLRVLYEPDAYSKAAEPGDVALVSVGTSTLDRYKVHQDRTVKLDVMKMPGGALDTYERTIAMSPLSVMSRLVDVDSGEEALRIAWMRDGPRTLVVDRGTAMNARDIVGLASKGFPVNSANARDIVEFITAFEAANFDHLRVERVSSHMGWQGRDGEHGFLWGRELSAPEGTVPVTFQGASGGDEQEADGYHACGTLEGWIEGVSAAQDFPLVHFPLYAACAAPLLRILNCPNFTVDLSNRTSTGKTTVMKVAASVAGRPDETGVVHSWKHTRVGYERLASVTTDLPMFLDDTKTARRPEVVGEILYDHANGRGMMRGNVDGLQLTSSWRSVLLSTGEGPAVDFTQDGGTRGRVLSLKGMPFGSDHAGKVVDSLNAAVSRHYGHALPLVIRFIQDHRAEWADWREAYECEVTHRASRSESAVAGRLAKYFAAVTFTAKLVHRAFAEAGYPLPWTARLDGLWAHVTAETGEAAPDIRALQDVYSWACRFKSKFRGAAAQQYEPSGGWYGRWEGDHTWTAVSFHTEPLKDFLVHQGYRPEEVLSAWKERGWLDLDAKGKNKVIRVGTSTVRMVTVKRMAFETVNPIEDAAA